MIEEKLIQRHPTLYHMAEKGAWEVIKEKGLLSTTALLDLYKVPQPDRRKIEERRRPENARIQGDGLSDAIIRDQKPMRGKDLKQRCLPDGMTPPDWYRLLNSKVFFWPTKKRLETMMSAYQGKPHDVLEIDTRSLVEAHRCCIWLSHMNTGSTQWCHPRDETTFARIRDYRYDQRPPGNPVAELAVDYAVPDIRNHVKRVKRMIMKDGKITCHVIEEVIGVPDHKPLSTRFRISCSQLSCLWRRFCVWLHSWRFRLSHLWRCSRVWRMQLL